jgi:hypothetical protein
MTCDRPLIRISRRDFLKLAMAGAASLFLPKIEIRADGLESWPGLNVEDLPPYYQNILSLTPKTDFSASGILRMGVAENGVNAMREVPVSQTKFNKKFLEIAKHSPNWRFVTDQPIGLAWHWFGDGPEFASTWYPNGTARDYIERGLCGDRSVQFIVGDGVPKPGQGALDEKLAIAQAELPDENGNWVTSAHIIEVDRSLYENGTQYFANASYSLFRDYGFANPTRTSILQRLYQPGYNKRPNVQLVGIEIQGLLFEDPAYFPSPQKLANVLAVSMALIKRHKISSPGFNANGHEELDFGKGDPGKNMILGMKILIGISALVSEDQELMNLVFGPFTLDGKITKEGAIAGYFNFIKDYFCRTTGPKSFVDYWLNYFHFDATPGIINSGIVSPQRPVNYSAHNSE